MNPTPTGLANSADVANVPVKKMINLNVREAKNGFIIEDYSSYGSTLVALNVEEVLERVKELLAA